MSRSHLGLALATLCLPLCLAQVQANPPAGRAPAAGDQIGLLPVKRVVLYKNGVGYFEHVGRIRGNQNVEIPFTSGQLNDVLKSLTVLDLNGGRITNVGYGSAAPVDRQLGDLRLPVGEKSSLTEFLGALRGARLEIRSGTTVISGRLLSVERKTRIAGGTTLEVDYLSLIGENGEVRTTELSPGFSVRLLDSGLAGRLGRYLDIVSAGREADIRRMVISTEGTGERSLFVSYISEVPVWKSTYRIMLSSKSENSPLLQGWAIVDNVLGQDWDSVQLSLVAGAPQSFIQNLSQPYYSRRPVVPLPESAAISPQTYEATLIPGGARLNGTITDPMGAAVVGARVRAFDANGSVVGEATADARGTYQLSSVPEGSLRLEVESPGFNRGVITGVIASAGRANQQDVKLQLGNVAQAVEVTASASPLGTSTSSVAMTSRTAGSGRMLGSGRGIGSGGGIGSGSGGGVGSGRGAGFGPGGGGGIEGGVFRVAAAQELGDLFEYRLKDPITIRQNRSALVPIVQSAIAAEKVSIWNDRFGWPRPQRALWLTNSTGLTLDGGSFSVLEEETFAGEGVFEPIKPGEKRLVSYAMDLAVNASSKNSTEQQRVTHVRVSQGTMWHDSEVREKKIYTFRNEDAAARTVIIEHPVRSGYELRSQAIPVETTADWMRFRVRVEPKQTATLVVEEARPISNTYALTNISSQQVDLFVRQQSIDRAVEEALREVLAQRGVISALEDQKTARDEAMDKIFDDQQRLRENMKALKGSAEEKQLLQRYTQQLNDQENRLEALRKEAQQLEAQQVKEQAVLDKMIQDLSFDVRL